MEPDLVRSLLLNLADNAQKSMEDGGELRFCQEMTERGCRIRVLDGGRGIPPQALKHLTEPFYRVDKARSEGKEVLDWGWLCAGKLYRSITEACGLQIEKKVELVSPWN